MEVSSRKKIVKVVTPSFGQTKKSVKVVEEAVDPPPCDTMTRSLTLTSLLFGVVPYYHRRAASSATDSILSNSNRHVTFEKELQREEVVFKNERCR